MNIPCEIYSRVAGYFRPVQNWNKGKKEEFSERKTINLKSQARRCAPSGSETQEPESGGGCSPYTSPAISVTKKA